MTETTKTVFEKHQVRKSKKQKSAFIEYVSGVAERSGYEARVEKGYFGARNIVVGDPRSAKAVYTAHYDTCARLPMPNFITPKNILIYILYQIPLLFAVIILPVLLASVIAGVILALLDVGEETSMLIGMLVGYTAVLFSLFMLIAGPANKHTANDNTSGVTLILDIMEAMPEQQRENAAFIFFDLEEMGLFGSAGYAVKHRSEMKNKLLLNFDCVSDGDNMLFLLKKGAAAYKERIEAAFPSCDTVCTEVLTRGAFYPSDQSNFPCGVGVAALKRSKKFGILYMNRIHTRRDTVYREENIEYLKAGALKLTEELSDCLEKV